MKHFLSENDKEFIIKNKDHLFSFEIGKKLGHSGQTITSFLRRNNLSYKSQHNKKYNPMILTPMENIIMQYLLMELNPQEISKELCISLSTVKTHINNISQKYQATGSHRITIAVLRHLKQKGLLVIE